MTATANTPTVGLLTAGSVDRPGGAGMRMRALEQAIDGCRRYEVMCDKWNTCAVSCLTTGIAHPAGHKPGWYYGRAYCPALGATLLDRLTSDGIRTVICSGLDSFPYVELLAAHPSIRVVYDTHNVEWPLHRAIETAVPRGTPFARRFPSLHVRRIGNAERAAVTGADEVWTCSEDDRRLLHEVYPEAHARTVRVVPNVVPVPDRPPAFGREPVRVTFTGRLDWYPNALATDLIIERIAPLLAGRGCPLPVVVAGASAGWPPRDPLPPNVRLIADPERTDDLIRDSVMLVPLTLGGGSRLKILEAFVLGTPVVSSAKGIEGLAAEPGTHYLPAEEPAEFADRTVELSRDPALRRRLGVAGWDLVRDRYSIHRLRAHLEAVGVAGIG